MKSIQEIIDAEIKEQNDEPRVSSGKFNPSSFGRCYRFQVWKRKGTPVSNPSDERTLRVFKVGSIIGNIVQDTVVRNHPQAKKEVLIEIEDIKGYADLVNETEVIEIKTQHSKAFHYMRKKTFDEIYADKLPNFLQVGWYTLQLGEPYKNCRLVYVSKDDMCIQEFAFPFSNKLRGDVESELCELRSFWEKDELPPAIPRAYGGKECQYCPFLKTCNETEEKSGRNKVQSTSA